MLDKFKGRGKTDFSIVYKFGHYSCMSILHTVALPPFQEIGCAVGCIVVTLGFFYKYMYLHSPFGSVCICWFVFAHFQSLAIWSLSSSTGLFEQRAQEGMLTREFNIFVFSSAKTSLSCESQTSPLYQCFALECCMETFNPLDAVLEKDLSFVESCHSCHGIFRTD